MFKGVSREDFERDKLANARALADESDDEVAAVPLIEEGKDGQIIMTNGLSWGVGASGANGKISKEEAMRRMIEKQIE